MEQTLFQYQTCQVSRFAGHFHTLTLRYANLMPLPTQGKAGLSSELSTMKDAAESLVNPTLTLRCTNLMPLPMRTRKSWAIFKKLELSTSRRCSTELVLYYHINTSHCMQHLIMSPQYSSLVYS